MATKPYYTRVSDVLAAALEKFGPNGERWVQGYEHGTRNGAEGKEHVFCMLGAVNNTTRGKLRAESIATLQQNVPGYTNIPSFNDAHNRKFAGVKAVFCAAIKTALKEEGKDGANMATGSGT